MTREEYQQLGKQLNYRIFKTKKDAENYINSFVPEIANPKIIKKTDGFAIEMIKNIVDKRRGFLKP